jgi:hypothetical protein
MAKIAMVQAKNGAARRNPENQNADNTVEIERLAYQFFVQRGYQHGHHDEDWLRAEAIIKNRKRL